MSRRTSKALRFSSRLAILAVALGSVTLAACYDLKPGGDVRDGAVADGDMSAPVDLGADFDAGAPSDMGSVLCSSADLATGVTYLYLLNQLAFAGPSTATPRTAPGFDLDGDSVVACGPIAGVDTEFPGQAPDYGVGIDNALSANLASLATGGGGAVPEVNDGTNPMLIEVRGVDSLVSDPCVGVTVYYGAFPSGVTPLHDTDGRLSPNQTINTYPSTFSDNSGHIVGGRLMAGHADFPFAFPILGQWIGCTLRAGQLRFDITADRMSVGVLGGSLPKTEVVAAINMVPSLASYVSAISGTLDSVADIDLDGSPASCEAASTVFAFSGVAAIRGAQIAR
jgi:predicted small secreted protein